MSEAPPPMHARLVIDKKGADGTYRVLLNDLDVAFLLAEDGLKVSWERIDWMNESAPVVTMKFSPDALDVELDVELVSYLQAQAQAKADAEAAEERSDV